MLLQLRLQAVLTSALLCTCDNAAKLRALDCATTYWPNSSDHLLTLGVLVPVSGGRYPLHWQPDSYLWNALRTCER